MPGHIDQLAELDDQLKAIDQLTNKQFLELIAENMTADITKCDYLTGRSLEYLSARCRRIAAELPDDNTT